VLRLRSLAKTEKEVSFPNVFIGNLVFLSRLEAAPTEKISRNPADPTDAKGVYPYGCKGNYRGKHKKFRLSE
jgi:hypothetical protein